MEIFDYYELLGVSPDATQEVIAAAYKEKIINVTNEFMSEKYKTAYITLSDDSRRYLYDKSIGIYKHRKGRLLVRMAKAIGRIILTLLDVICTFYWCFFIAVILACAIYVAVNVKQPEETGIYDFLLLYKADIYKFLLLYKEELKLLVLFALEDLLTHFYIRRGNRKLKAVNWEVRVKNKEEQKNGVCR